MEQKISKNASMFVLSRVVRYMLRLYKIPFFLVVVCILLSAVSTVTAATFPQSLVDDYAVPMPASGSTDFSALAQALVRLACLLAVGIAAAFAYNRIMVTVSQGTMLHLRNDLFRRMEALPIKYFDTHAHGDIMSVYTNDVDTLRQLLSQSVPQMINSAVTMVATLVTMLPLNPALTVISIATAAIMLEVTANFSKLSGKYYIQQQKNLGINGLAGVTLGTVVSFVGLNKSFTQPITQISMQVNFVVTAAAGAQRVFDLMDQQPEEDQGSVELVNARQSRGGKLEETKERTNVWAWKQPQSDGTVAYTRLEGGVVFENVDFGYNKDKLVLHDISLWAKPGQKIAFVGATGAGKTTITNLINRFYDIADGFIRRLPDGYDTMLTGDGANLSQGQRQLLAIARAAVADPPVLILDEATSSIDTRTEKLVQDGMDALMTGRTTFVIAHRLSTVRTADCIMVMEQGRIIERGTHDELIEKKGKYYQIYTGNFAEETA
ncbi:ABC transporter ATP-binding protein [uncultured Oscillibacter sp.]|uniref:ABC transporter ATP-binding protein n=1 Tax=uncultured Oscillibacter sp. TaxID=876091 RepID=UPI00280A6618|nr:ABC transporter ATP-binding protein [uncultured Oscillibacter sp.]